MAGFHQVSRRALLQAGAAGAVLASGAGWAAAPTPTALIRTSNGPIQGLVENAIHTFKGVRYGAPPIGAGRFKPPQRPAAWTETRAALGYGAPAMQLVGGATAYPPTDFATALHTIFPASSEINQDNEDCLFLNVWTPSTTEGRRPVMVWLHGGGFAYGSGAWPLYDGANLARRGDVVVVTVNHRLNVFGYLDLSGVGGADYAQSGNAGMLDLVLALEWVRDNADKFGGDAGNVTIMGESGGGAKVSALCAMPSARGLFHKAIIQSGPGLQGVAQTAARANAQSVMQALGATDVAALTAMTADDILAGAGRAGGGSMGFRLSPVVDGAVLPRDPFVPDAPAISADVPILIGWNKDEMSLFNTGAPWWGTLTEEDMRTRVTQQYGAKADALIAALRAEFPDYSPTYLFNAAQTASTTFIGSVTLAQNKARQRRAPVYMYNLVWDTPVGGGVFKSPHTLDIPFMFDNIDKAEVFVGTGPAPRALADQMSNAWIAFAKTGNPNAQGLPNWPAYETRRRQTMLFDVTPRVVSDPLGRVRQVLQS